MATEPAQFTLSDHACSVLVTRRSDGGLQASPVRVMLDANDQITATTRSATAKARNLRRDPRFALCVIDDNWPRAVDDDRSEDRGGRRPARGLAETARSSTRGSAMVLCPRVEEWEKTMVAEGRVIVLFTPDRSTPMPASRGTRRR